MDALSNHMDVFLLYFKLCVLIFFISKLSHKLHIRFGYKVVEFLPTMYGYGFRLPATGKVLYLRRVE